VTINYGPKPKKKIGLLEFSKAASYEKETCDKTKPNLSYVGETYSLVVGEEISEDGWVKCER
jgi:hypothetical protein